MSMRILSSLVVVTLLVAFSGCATFPDQDEIASVDEQIAQDAITRIHYDDALARAGAGARLGIGVTVSDGVATVTGSVPSESIRMHVLSIVRGTPGVVEVEDRLTRSRW